VSRVRRFTRGCFEATSRSQRNPNEDTLGRDAPTTLTILDRLLPGYQKSFLQSETLHVIHVDQSLHPFGIRWVEAYWGSRRSTRPTRSVSIRPQMTLNITVVTEKRIYQSADYRLTDLLTGRKYDDARNQKIFVAAGDMWLATVCFNGVGRTADFEVSPWLSDVCSSTTREESLDAFLARLQSADSWLSNAAPRNRRHSFIVAGFAGRTAIISLVSNYERFDRPPAVDGARRLTIHQLRPSRPQAFISGQRKRDRWPRRRALAALAQETTDVERVFTALARANREVAKHNEFVSPSCFTTYVQRTGKGRGQPHEIDIPARPERIGLMRGAELLLRSPDFRGGTLRQFAFAYAWPTDEYHAIQLEDNPENPETHSNYGVYLLDKKNDVDGAERAFREALAIDPAYVNAIGNLAHVILRRGGDAEADALYRQALDIAPGQENATYNYVAFLVHRRGALTQARGIVESGIRLTPTSGRLRILLGEIELLEGRPGPALAAFRDVRTLRAEQALVEAGYAVALHMSGAPIEDCIASYRTAIALNPTIGGLHLNMAQLMYAVGLNEQGKTMLRRAWQLKLDAQSQLEAHFYEIAHGSADAAPAVSSMRRLLETGARMNWNMAMTLERVRTLDPTRAKLLSHLRDVLVGNAPISNLGELDLDNGSSAN
jgi:Tfp pilus assembly protein PilF